jgi:hypothetical protein
VAVDHLGSIYVVATGSGRVLNLNGGTAETVLDGLSRPEGIAIAGDKLYVLDVAAKSLVELDLSTGQRRNVANHLPVGAPEGIIAPELGAVGSMCGPMLTFSGLSAGPDGTIYVAASAEGSVIAVRKMPTEKGE